MACKILDAKPFYGENRNDAISDFKIGQISGVVVIKGYLRLSERTISIEDDQDQKSHG